MLGFFYLVVSLVIIRNMMLCVLHITLGIASIWTWNPWCEKINRVRGHKLVPPPALKKCYLHANILCIKYWTIKACLRNGNFALLDIFRHFSNMLQVHSLFLVPGKQNCCYLCKEHRKYLLWASWIKECLRNRFKGTKWATVPSCHKGCLWCGLPMLFVKMRAFEPLALCEQQSQSSSPGGQSGS